MTSIKMVVTALAGYHLFQMQSTPSVWVQSHPKSATCPLRHERFAWLAAM